MNRGADFEPKSCNRKLAPVRSTPGRVRPHFEPAGPYICTTTVSIQSTCPDSCIFKSVPGVPGGCYADAGFTRIKGEELDEGSRHLTADEVIAEEARLIIGAFGGGWIPQDGARGGRDLRIHVGGDVSSEAGARMLAVAAGTWPLRGGGAVFTFTHRASEVPREAWGDQISVLASVEKPTDIVKAWARGYAAAIVLEELPADGKAFLLPGAPGKVIPCPAQTRAISCVACRLCMRDKFLVNRATIAFEAHGQRAEKAREALRMVNAVALPVVTAPTVEVQRDDLNAASRPAERTMSTVRGPPRAQVSGPLETTAAATGLIDDGARPPAASESLPRSTGTELFKTATEIAAAVGADVSWISEPWVAAGAITHIDGKPKAAGKSTFVLRMVAAVLSGADFLGRPTTRSPVVFLSEERASTFRASLRRAGLLDAKDFHVVFHKDAKSMSWPDVMTLALQKCKAVGARLLIIDTLAQFCPEADSHGRKALEAMQPVQAVAAEGIGIVCIRHERKSGGDVGDSARGGTAVTGAADVVLAIRRPPEYPAARVISALSRFDETPSTTIIELGDDGYVAIDGSRVGADEEAGENADGANDAGECL